MAGAARLRREPVQGLGGRCAAIILALRCSVISAPCADIACLVCVHKNFRDLGEAADGAWTPRRTRPVSRPRSHSPASAWLRRERSEERRIQSDTENNWDEFEGSVIWRACLAASSKLPPHRTRGLAHALRAAPPPPMSGGGRCTEIVNVDGTTNVVIDLDSSQGQEHQPQEVQQARMVDAPPQESAAQVNAPLQIEIGAPTTPSNKREAPEQWSPPKMSRSQSSQEPTNSTLMSMLQIMVNQQNAAQTETKQFMEQLHTRAEAADQRVEWALRNTRWRRPTTGWRRESSAAKQWSTQ